MALHEKLLRELVAAVAAGDSKAEAELGSRYYEGEGVAQNFPKANELLRKAAAKGVALALFYLGLSYYDGKGNEKNHKLAVKFFKRAAEKGDLDAMAYLGTCYEFGEGVGKQPAKAAYWYSRAADKGDRRALYALVKLGAKLIEGTTSDLAVNNSALMETLSEVRAASCARIPEKPPEAVGPPRATINIGKSSKTDPAEGPK